MLNSNTKGKAFERKVAALLTDWSGLKFGRTPMSGAFASEPGDIICLEADIRFQFCVECKNQEGWAIDNLLQNNGVFPGWMAQMLSQAENKTQSTNRLYWPMLIFTRNRRPIYIMIPRLVALAGGYLTQTHIVLKSPMGQYVVGEASDLLKDLDYTRIKEYHERINTGLESNHKEGSQ